MLQEHCYRDNTQYNASIEIKKVYKHPAYKFPSLYNDIAVIELGRRVVYDFEKYGDSPICLDNGKHEVIGDIATIQGYGVTETGLPSGELLESNVTVISLEKCKENLLDILDVVFLMIELIYFKKTF